MSVRRSSLGLVAVAALTLLGGCARYVVLDPELVASRNSADWTIRSQPRGPSVAPAPPPP